MEMLFPPSFFTLMIHLIVYLADEAKLGGPVYYRWMYPIERYLGLLKSYVRNKAKPEGSIVEYYITQEVITFFSQYLDDIETIWNRPSMSRTKRHIMTSNSANSIVDPTHSIDPGTSMPTPQINAQVEEVGPQINAQVQEGGHVHQSAVERDEPQLFRGCKRSTTTWDVKIRDGNGELKRQKMQTIDVYSLRQGEKVVVEWNSRNQLVELSWGMLAQFLGHIASNCQNFPIGCEKWQKIPECYKDHVWNNIIKTKLEVNDHGHKRYIFKSLAKKWRDSRYNLYNLMKCDPDGPREANIARKPPEIPLEQWVAFVDYRARPNTKVKAEQHTINRTHQTMPHTLGS
ncbi:uncharacterized protein LOC120265186 [Dioscorea cayenensis subsp. rotundata]|uniref:Uncharacterized protein LOC120265186 n=1 Tax=Dioscorea cayennensis subsp. rotundata TaxID=55577 RepID=A0AB40BNK3_DIOCR|nr:uncharacterized protein LOC120265186 [Dioscorea cayenensis subsp. rotundata]